MTFLILASTPQPSPPVFTGVSFCRFQANVELPKLDPPPSGIIVRADIDPRLMHTLVERLRALYPGAWLVREDGASLDSSSQGCDIVVPTLELGLRVLTTLCPHPFTEEQAQPGPTPGPLGWFRTDVSGRIIWASPGLYSLIDWSPAKHTSLWSSIEPSEDDSHNAARWLQLFRDGGEVEFAVRGIRGEFVGQPLRLQAAVVRDDTGSVRGISGALTRIVESDSPKDSFADGLKAVVDFLGDPTLVARGPRATVQAVSENAEGFLRVDSSRLHGQPVSILHPELTRWTGSAGNLRDPLLEAVQVGWISRDGKRTAEARVSRTCLGPDPQDLWWIIEYPEADKREHKQELHKIAGILASPGEGRELLQHLVEGLSEVLGVANAMICEVDNHLSDTARILASASTELGTGCYEFKLQGTVTERVLQRRFICVARDVDSEFPRSELLTRFGYRAYMGVALTDEMGAPMGALAILDRKPLSKIKELRSILLLFRVRAAAELVRIRRLAALQKRAILLADVQRIAGVGGWEYSVSNDKLLLDPVVADSLGLAGRAIWDPAEFFDPPSCARFRSHILGLPTNPEKPRHPIRLSTRTGPCSVQVILLASGHHDEGGTRIIRGAMSNADALKTETEHSRILYHQIEVMLKNAPILFLWVGREGVVKYCAGGSFPGSTRKATDSFGRPLADLLRTAAERRAAAQIKPGEATHLTLEAESGRVFEVWTLPMNGNDGAPDGHLSMSIERYGCTDDDPTGSVTTTRTLASSLCGFGFWEWRQHGDSLNWSPECLALLGWDMTTAPPTAAKFEEAYGCTGRLRHLLEAALLDHVVRRFTLPAGDGRQLVGALAAPGTESHHAGRVIGAIRVEILGDGDASIDGRG